MKGKPPAQETPAQETLVRGDEAERQLVANQICYGELLPVVGWVYEQVMGKPLLASGWIVDEVWRAPFEPEHWVPVE